jgi:hypothetical protein
MSIPISNIYEFTYRGLLAEEALDREGRRNNRLVALEDSAIAQALSLDVLDDVNVANAKAMALVYTAIAAFENSVRSLVLKTLADRFKEEWWEKGVSKGIRDRAEKRLADEEQVRWHAQRGNDPINYTTFGDLKNVMQNNWDCFEVLIGSLPWASGIFDVVERSRNVIMHSGTLEREDIERLGVNIRDWIKQVGA